VAEVSLTYKRFKSRPIDFQGIHEVDGYRLKVYSILYGSKRFESAFVEKGITAALKALPEPALTDTRPGVGFLIVHLGLTGDYLVLCWWDNENELPIRVFVFDNDRWRPAQGSESVCVWDLEVLWFERQAYVETVLRHSGRGVEEYMKRTMHKK
jgi:hypothetical protein